MSAWGRERVLNAWVDDRRAAADVVYSNGARLVYRETGGYRYWHVLYPEWCALWEAVGRWFVNAILGVSGTTDVTCAFVALKGVAAAGPAALPWYVLLDAPFSTCTCVFGSIFISNVFRGLDPSAKRLLSHDVPSLSTVGACVGAAGRAWTLHVGRRYRALVATRVTAPAHSVFTLSQRGRREVFADSGCWDTLVLKTFDRRMRRSFLFTMSALSDNGVGERAGAKVQRELSALAETTTLRASFGLFGLLWAAALGIVLLAGVALVTPYLAGVI